MNHFNDMIRYDYGHIVKIEHHFFKTEEKQFQTSILFVFLKHFVSDKPPGTTKAKEGHAVKVISDSLARCGCLADCGCLDFLYWLTGKNKKTKHSQNYNNNNNNTKLTTRTQTTRLLHFCSDGRHRKTTTTTT